MTEIKLKQVRKSYGTVKVLQGIDLTVGAGEFCVFVGPSGCGKSTLLRIIAGLDDVSSGTIEIDGETVNNLSASSRGLAMVFQSYALYPHMSVYKNMAFGLENSKMPKPEIDRRVREAAELLQITDYLDRKPKALSGGQRQRVAIGRAIVRNPDVFLFDEPLSNLDAALRHDTRVEIAKLHNQLDATTIYVTHDQVEAMTLADKIVVLKDGEVMQVGAPMDLFNMPANEFVAGFLGSPQRNFFDGKLGTVDADGGRAEFVGEGLDVKGVRLVSSDKKARDSARLGVRPQNLVLDAKGQLEGTITLVERLGTETIVELKTTGGTGFRFATSERLDLSSGQAVRFSFDPSLAHLF